MSLRASSIYFRKYQMRPLNNHVWLHPMKNAPGVVVCSLVMVSSSVHWGLVWWFYLYSSGLLHWHWVNHIAPGEWSNPEEYDYRWNRWISNNTESKQSNNRWRYSWDVLYNHLDGLAQDCSISSALAMEMLQFCSKFSIYCCHSILWSVVPAHLAG